MGIIRKTKSLELIENVFKQSKNAFSAVDMVSRFNKKMNKTTVYRVLERLENEGFVHSFTDKEGLKWYAKCNECSIAHHHDVHPHFQCKKCGKIECLQINIQIPNTPNHKIDNSEIFLIGTCETCFS